VRPAPFSGVALPMKLSPPTDCHKIICPAEFPCSRRACSSLSGGSRQPLDRQLSYYRELKPLASKHCGFPSRPEPSPPRRPRKPQTQETPLKRVALRCLALSLASQKISGRRRSQPYLMQTSSAGLPFQGRCAGGRSCRVHALLWAGQNSSSARTSLAPI